MMLTLETVMMSSFLIFNKESAVCGYSSLLHGGGGISWRPPVKLGFKTEVSVSVVSYNAIVLVSTFIY